MQAEQMGIVFATALETAIAPLIKRIAQLEARLRAVEGSDQSKVTQRVTSIPNAENTEHVLPSGKNSLLSLPTRPEAA
jgi:hypothetical protein